jgi:hypothetical protein
MDSTKYQKLEIVSLKGHPVLNERWVQDRIAEDPSILGLGELILRDRERPQPRAGILDLLLQDAELPERYEVEIQLGKTDESHIIRTIEYWDVERRRYPNYDHNAVLVAEDITARFLNVISLFNGFIPLIAIQMKAVAIGDTTSLLFTKVLDKVTLGLEDEDDEAQETVDRTYWEKRGSKVTLSMADDIVAIAKAHDPRLEPTYRKYYIGLARGGVVDNFIKLRPQKAALRFEPRLERHETIEQALDAAGLDTLDYDTKWSRYRIRLLHGDVAKHRELVEKLLTESLGSFSESR